MPPRPVTDTRLMTDADLVICIQGSGDLRFFGELYRRYFRRLFDYCRQWANDADTAGDLAQTAFVKAIEKIDTLRSPQTFMAWLFRIARNESLNQLAVRNNRRYQDLEQCLHLPDAPMDVEALRAREDREWALHKSLATLPDESRNLLTLKYVDNHSVSDLAEQYGIGESAVKMRLLRARAQVVRQCA